MEIGERYDAMDDMEGPVTAHSHRRIINGKEFLFVQTKWTLSGNTYIFVSQVVTETIRRREVKLP